MDFCSENHHNERVFMAMKEDYASGMLVPFVGAGLSVPYYPLWPKALEELAGGNYSILSMLNENPPKLLEVAQQLENCWGEGEMADNLLSLFSADKLKGHEKELLRQCVGILPILFPTGPVVTTNFDRILETVYQEQGNKFDRVILPGNTELHDQLFQGGRHGLLKVHGDIGSETIEYSSIIFTQRQYNSAYKPNSKIVKDLRNWFSSKKMLFLGCSLNIDQTIDLLRRIVSLHKGITHYAIVECPDKGTAYIMSRIKELRDQLGIRTIIYPKGKHESVQIILEKLLQDVFPNKYQALPERIGTLQSAGIKGIISDFHYKSEITDFLGRDVEMEKLRAFCNSNESFYWWAITAPGGAGKSRLAFELTRELRNSGWTVYWPQTLDENTLNAFVTTQKTIVIIDYVQAYASQVGKWMAFLAGQDRILPIRILLLERDGDNLENSSWGKLLLSGTPREGYLQQFCWEEDFMILPALKGETLKKIMRQYAQKKGKNLSAEQEAKLLEVLGRIDPNLCRPLYALFLTDIWLNDSTLEQRDQKEVLQYILRREKNYFKEKCNSLIGNNARLFAIIQKIRIVSTIWGDLCLDQLKKMYPNLWRSLQQQEMYVNCAENEEDLLYQLGIYNGNNFLALQPDLLGEYFVLDEINKRKDYDLIFIDYWGEYTQILTFFFRIFSDYREEIEQVPIIWEKFTQFSSKDIEHYYLYNKILINVIIPGSIYSKQAAQILELQYIQHQDNLEVAQHYAVALANLSNAEPSERASNSQKLEQLFRAFQNNKIIILSYAQSLVHLSSIQTLEESLKSLEKVEQLATLYEGNIGIAISYAWVLANLTYKQPVEDAVLSVEKIEELYKKYKNDVNIANAYAKGLYNLSVDQSVEEAAKSKDKLEKLVKMYDGDSKIAILYAHSLVNLSMKQSTEKVVRNVEMLENLTQKYQSEKEFLFLYVSGLVNLSAKQSVDDAARTIEKLERIANEYTEERLFLSFYAKSLYNLSCDQSAEDASKSAEKLENLAREHKDDLVLVIEYVRCLANLSIKQSAADAARSLERIKLISEEYPEVDQAINYATIAFHTYLKQIEDILIGL